MEKREVMLEEECYPGDNIQDRRSRKTRELQRTVIMQKFCTRLTRYQNIENKIRKRNKEEEFNIRKSAMIQKRERTCIDNVFVLNYLI